jgi:methylmalonyl-CoA mutase N-terminal domain/subunit
MQIHRVDPEAERRQAERTQRVRRERDNHKVNQLLDALAQQARDPSANLMPGTIEAVRARATLGEIVSRLKDVFGTYTERPAL